MVERFRKKPVIVEAAQLTAENVAELARWCGGMHMAEKNGIGETISEWIDIETLEGTMSARLGWWIIKGVRGEFYPCEPEIFAETYERVSDQINYDGSDPSVECAYPPCNNRLRKAAFSPEEDDRQWCSKEHRRLTNE